ncbi:(2Fe-2S) ferredoxin domain-containing protein [Aquimarina sp. AD10]|uniref:(2Fe-2S) ferredoxin domain-containing protein n=1 Tax=Aquimarina TaxID=290174 RepID=UPI000E52CD2F|nr:MULTISPECIES: (2Fe-2S) ferredoxin domain-containing protein [Aquimarina]AXT63041.1 (2Fe-2S) ferredoxin domain-containing protein [Aquimarina sp. AD10]RKM96842.1 (2Fe-2S) ferredoxin domain-containing protein [Aquimarina sp. AD10]
MGKNIPKVSTTFQFCDGGSCQKAKSEVAVREARAYLRNQGVWDETHTIKTRCNGRCEDAPTWIVQPGNFWYKNVTPEKAVAIVKSHVEKEQPQEEYLLFKEGWSVLLTENEKTVAPPVFKYKKDIEYGEVLIARAFASDQHLYPLFQYFFQQPRPIGVQIGAGEIIVINQPHTVDYNDKYEVKITGEQLELALTIAGIPKDIAEDIADRKVSIAEVIWQRKKTIFTKVLRLKNKKGKHLASFWIKEEDNSTWEHLLTIYLSMQIDNIRIEDDLSVNKF